MADVQGTVDWLRVKRLGLIDAQTSCNNFDDARLVPGTGVGARAMLAAFGDAGVSASLVAPDEYLAASRGAPALWSPDVEDTTRGGADNLGRIECLPRRDSPVAWDRVLAALRLDALAAVYEDSFSIAGQVPLILTHENVPGTAADRIRVNIFARQGQRAWGTMNISAKGEADTFAVLTGIRPSVDRLRIIAARTLVDALLRG